MSLQAANTAAVLAVATRLAWTTTTVTSDAVQTPPLADGVGHPCDGAVWGRLRLRCREVVGTRTCIFAIDTYNAAADYTVTINGSDVTLDAADHSTEVEALDDLVTAVNADGTVGALVTAIGLDADGDDSSSSGQPTASIRLRGDTDSDYSYDAAATAGTLTLTADATGALAYVYSRASGDNAPAGWVRDELDEVSCLADGADRRIRVSSYQEVALIVVTVGRHPADGTDVVARTWASVGSQTLI